MDIYFDFIFSSLLLLALVYVYEFATTSVKFPSETIEVVISGVTIGLMTVVILTTPVHISKGIFVDARWVLLSCCAIFLNWRIVIIGGVIAASYRYFQGGAGAFPGVMTVITAILVGYVWRYALVKFNIEFKWYLHYIFAFTLEVIIIAVIYTFMPEGKGATTAKIITEPLLVLFPIVSTILSLLLQYHWEKPILPFK
ncbi:LytS/YhcK type 5TM receptor domain-containing protein [Thermodesulfobacteriota bacterium]